MTEPEDFSTLSFEQAMQRLEKIVSALESGKAGLEDSIRYYEEGVKLRQHCESKLRDAQLRVETLTVAPNGQVQTEPFKTN